MPSTYTLNNGIELIGTGEQSGTWGDTTNLNLELLDTALDGQVTVTLSSTGTSGSPNVLPISDGTSSNGRNRMVIFNDGGDIGGTVYVQLTPNDAEKIVYVRNSLSGSRSILLFQGTYNASNDYEIPAGTTAIVFFNGAGTGAVASNVFNNAYFDSLRLGGVSVTAIIDDDTMGTAAATNIATSESIKAYVDAQVTAQDLDFGGDSGTGAVDLDSQTFTIAGTTNEIETSASGQTLTVGLPDNVKIAGNLTVDTDTLYVDSANNNVGIGLTNPTSHNANAVTLQVDGGTNGSELRLTNDTTGTASSNGFHIATVGNKAYLVQNEADDLYFYANGAEVLRMNSSQQSIFGASANRQVLVNTTDNTNALDATFILQNNTQASTHGKLFIASGTTTPTQNLGLGFVGFGDSNKVPNAFIGVYDDGATWTTGSDMPTRMAFWTTADGASSATERMRIDNAGRVGIKNSSMDLFGAVTGADLFVIGSGAGSQGMTIYSGNSGAGNIAFADGTTTTQEYEGLIQYDHGSNFMDFYSNHARAMRIDSSQRVLIGYSDTFSNAGHNAAVQVVGQGTADYHGATVSINGFSNNSNGAYLNFGSGRSNTAGTYTIVANDDTLGLLLFAGADGSNLNSYGASIGAFVDGAPGSTDMPGRLVFSTTADGASGSTERMRITSSGTVLIGGQTDYGVARTYLTQRTDDDGFGVVDANQTYTTLLYANAAGSVLKNNTNLPFSFQTSNTTAMTIDSSQRVLIGLTTARTEFFDSGVAPILQVQDSGSNAAIAIIRTDTSADGPSLLFGRSHGTGYGLIDNGDRLGRIPFQGADGVDFEQSASIDAYVDGAPGVQDMPGRLSFSTTPDGTNAAVERMRIDNEGQVTITSNRLTINSGDSGSNHIHLRRGAAPSLATFYADIGYVLNGNGNAEALRLGTGSSSDAIQFYLGDGNLDYVFNSGPEFQIRGDVSIGSNIPTYRGNIIIANGNGTSAAGGLEFHTSSAGGAGYGARITTDSSGNMYFQGRNNSSGWTTRAYIYGGGGGFAVGTGGGTQLYSNSTEFATPLVITNTNDSSEWGAVEQKLNGQITAGASGAWKDIIRADHTHALDVKLIASATNGVSNGSGTAVYNTTVAYGGGQQTVRQVDSYINSNLTDVELRYFNGSGTSGTNYVLQVKVTYANISSPTVFYTVTGHSVGRMYNV